jgi:pyruvate dehydrogenase E2 component (dihydrolipoamide acetyltransferase)
MISEVTVPDIGEFKNIPVIEILVKLGDHVQKDTPLIVLESDKATLDIPSPQAGVIKEVRIAIGDRVSRGSTILALEMPGDAIATDPPPVTTVPTTQFTTPTKPVDAAKSIGKIIASREPTVTVSRRPGGSPSVRRFARELGVNLETVNGSGPRGRILKEDLHRFVKTALAVPPTATSNDGTSPVRVTAWPQIDFSQFGKIERKKLTRIRQLAGDNLARNWALIPHVTNFEDADITDLDAFRTQLNLERSGTASKITVLAFLLKAVTATLAKYPEFNASLAGDELILKRYFHIGFAVDTPHGLMVPVIRAVDTKGIRQIAEETSLLAAQCRDGKLKLADMQGGCFTISSLGGIGGTGFTPIINAPEVAILGVTRAQVRPVWDGKLFQPRLIQPLTLSWDHRVIDGAAAARFLKTLASLLADFRRVLL